MGKLNLDELQSGMHLAADVKDLNGRVLLKAGSEITDRHLILFRMWGVTEAEIDGVHREDIVQKAVEQLDPALLNEAEAAAKELFRQTDRLHPAVAELYRLATRRMVRRKKEGPENAL